MDGERRRDRVKTLLVGGVLGASATVAALNRRRRIERRRGRPRGLAAFESAPCYRELLDRESDEAGGTPR